jgi:lantibiotic modifying enzyme
VPGAASGGGPGRSLYAGTPGVVAFYLELHAHTGEPRFLAEAVAGAREVASWLPARPHPALAAGLYDGLAGQLTVLRLAHRASGDAGLRAAAARAGALLAQAAVPEPGTPGAAAWSTTNDVIAGAAGTGLALLAARDLLGDRAVDAARGAGDALVARARPVADGRRRWMMNATFAREMPNFSHGTAGVAYFLATLAARGGEPRHREAALDGARYLAGIAAPAGDGSLIRHHDGDGERLFYLGWCHGPCGTGLLWQRLAEHGDASRWRALEDAGARGVVAQGVPEVRTPGFWHNISRCCGNAGVAEYFVARHARTRSAADLAYARRHADDLLRRGTTDGEGTRWVQAENRVSPQDVAAQTGWMQGAAGIGAMLLRLDAAVEGRQLVHGAPLPDAPAGLP